MSNPIPQDPQLLEGDQQRCACVLLLDTSGSMGGTPIDELNKGLRIFQEELQADPLSRKRVDVAVVSFDSVVTPVQPFVNATQFSAPQLSAQGGTEMAGGISKALELVANPLLSKINGYGTRDADLMGLWRRRKRFFGEMPPG